MSIDAARAAFRRGALAEARVHLETSLAAEETPEALEELGLVAWWGDDAPTMFDARERAYRLYRDRGDARGAARLALWLVWDSLAFRGDTAVAAGWLERARRLLEGHERTPEYGWLLAREGEVSLFRMHDPLTARTNAVHAADLGRQLGDRALEFTGLALEGLARVSAGDVTLGMRRLDEAAAAATAGEVKELHAVGIVCCWQIFACERVRDFERAAQWCSRLEDFTSRWPLRPLSAVCRTNYAGVLIWRGKWAQAEETLLAAARDLDATRPAQTVQAIARLGELRLRQGQLDEAERLFELSNTQLGSRLGRAALMLERGDPDASAKELERILAFVGTEERTLLAGALELLVRAQTERGDQAGATRALGELRSIGETLGSTPMAGSVALAEGIVARRYGTAQEATRAFARAADLYQLCGAPFEAAQARFALAQALAEAGDRAAAAREARLARDAFHGLGARLYEERATHWLDPVPVASSGGSRLTARQSEILRLVAQGLSNPEIAARLELSEHTVKRHVANLFARLRLSSRAAAAVYAARNGFL
jgi:DNA-binding NarL/FixJ family response regulator